MFTLPLQKILDGGERNAVLRPMTRQNVSVDYWIDVARAIHAGEASLAGLWSDGQEVFLALRLPGGQLEVLTQEARAGRFQAIGQIHAPAQRLERSIRDIYGLTPDGVDIGQPMDDRPWLDHGQWGVTAPGGQGAISGKATPMPPSTPYRFLQAEGAPLHQIPVGPVHAGIIEPGHFRFSANGETIVRLEERLGYTHKGVESLMRKQAPHEAAKIAARISGDSTVAYSFCFARAVEVALGVAAPPSAVAWRGIMAEMERLANHIGDIGAICNDAAFALMLAHTSVLREKILRCAHTVFGHRLMMDRIIPGGVAFEPSPTAAKRIAALLDDFEEAFPPICALYDSTNSLQDRTVGAGKLNVAMAAQFAAGGYIGRASGRGFDARRAEPYAPYDSLRFETPLYNEGCVDARVRVRMEECVQSCALIRQLIELPLDGALCVKLTAPASVSEGLAVVEGFRGDILCFVRIDATGLIAHCHLRDPSWFQWPLLEAAIVDNIVADFPLCNKSFNCSYSGHDL